jgi:hypothetical protein
MISVPKIVLIVLLVFAALYVMRWLNRVPADNIRRRRPPPERRPRAIEDLVACRACGAYVAPGAGGCGKADCPQQR